MEADGTTQMVTLGVLLNSTSKEPHRSLRKGTAGFTLLDILICLAVISILATIAIPVHLHAVEQAKAVEATEILSEVTRLEHLRYMEQATYTANLQELGFQATSSLKYFELFIQVHQDDKGWSYMAFAMPLGGYTSAGGGWAVAQYAGGRAEVSLPGKALKGGGACSIWSGWGAMEGGRIEGEETIGSTGGGGSPCGGRRTVNHGKK
jgi:prepilin-type N-terminal cleavage/methylation domain-containing protein